MGFFTDRSPPMHATERAAIERISRPHQHYWRCEHFPSAIENFFLKRTGCLHMCQSTKLESWHSGTHRAPTLQELLR
jgi:hypothetical protein